jgi:hypothetical protein
MVADGEITVEITVLYSDRLPKKTIALTTKTNKQGE